jgi:poly(3-hydroxybutyrate) depolymerase
MRRALLECGLIAIGMTAASPGFADQLAVNGRTRSYVIERPAATGPQPTIIVLHGERATAADVARSTNLGTLAPQRGFVAVFPEGPKPHWNFFLPGKELEFYVKASKATGGLADDGALLKSLVRDLVQRGIADPRRVYLAGESSGSVMALRMLCTDADLFAGMALLGPAMPERTGPECHPSRPVPMLLIKGTKDEVFPYAGGVIKPEETFLVWPQDRLVSFLQKVDNHSEPPHSSVLPRRVPNTVAIDRWESCSGALLTVYRVIDGPQIAPADLNVGQTVLDFFSSPMRSNACVASSPPGVGANPGASPAANPHSGPAGTRAGTDPNSQGSTPGTGTDPGNTPSAAATDPGAPNNTPGNGTGPTAFDPNSPGAPGDDNAPGGDTGGLGPPSDPNNPGTDTAALGPPPDEPTANPTGGLGPPPDPPMNNPLPTGPTTVMLPPPVYPPIYIPIPGNVCHPKPKPPGNVCNPKPPNVCNPKSATSAPPNPCNKPVVPLKLRPPPTQTAAVPPPQNTGMLHLKPATPVPVIPASVKPTGPANPCAKSPPEKKKEVEKKPRPKHDNRAANAAANAAATAATAAAIISIVGAVSRRGGGGGGGHGGGGYRGNPCHHR